MSGNLVSYALHYGCMLIEAALIIYVAWGRRLKSEITPAFYVAFLLAVDLARACVLRLHGLASREYSYVYWTTDFLLVVCACVLVCLFFRRACIQQEKLWRFVRLLLVFILVLVVGISGLSFLRHYSQLFTYIVVEFNQNLYFTCLVLITLLYMLLQQIESTDDELGLLVCGVGLQFSGPAATMALLHLTSGGGFAASLNSFIIPVSTLGMLLVWAHALVHVKDRATQVAWRKIPALAGVTADSNV
jgi:membrane-associated HD superfamily phosphohydrolase